MDDGSTAELGVAEELTMDDFLRTLVSQMFDNDNDTSFLKAKLCSTDGTESDLEFQIRITSINGVATREELEDE